MSSRKTFYPLCRPDSTQECSIQAVRSFLLIWLPHSNVHNTSGQLRNIKRLRLRYTNIEIFIKPLSFNGFSDDIATINMM